MATFEDFLNEKNITLKRRYTENHPARTVSGSARVRNSIIKALKNNKITLEEFNELVNKNTIDSKRWSNRNKRFFKIEEDGVSLSKYGTKILNSLVTESEVNEGTYDSKDHIGSTSDGQGSNAEIYKKGRGYYVVVSGQHDYDFEAKNDKELINKLEEYEFDSSDILESIDEGLNKSDVAYQLAIDYTGGTKPKITKLDKKRIQIKYGYKISPETVIDSIKKVHPEVELKHVEWSDKMSGGGFHIFDILESAVTEARYDKKKLLKKLGDADDATIQTGDGKEYIIYNPDSNNDDNAAMWHDKSVFAVTRDGDEYEIDYKDIQLVMTESIGHAEVKKLEKSLSPKDKEALTKAIKDGTIKTSKDLSEWAKSIKESVNEARVSAKKLLKSVVNGETNSVEGIKLSKDMAQSFLDWLDQSSYGRKFSELPFDKLFTAAFNWGIERYAKDSKLKTELKDLKTKAKAMKESNIYTDFSEFVTESLNEAKPKINIGRYQREGKLGHNDQFHGKHSLSFTLGIDLGLDPKNEFSGGDWPGFDGVDLYINGGKKEGTVLADALSGEHTYDDLKSALAKFLGIKESTIYTDSGQFINESLNEKSIKDWFTANIDSFKDEKEYMKAGKKAGFSKKELETAMDDFEQGGEDYLESNEVTEEKTTYTKFSEFVNEALEINEALKSSKLRGLLTMKKGTKNLLKAIYGFSKIALDKITDDQIIDIDPREGKKAEGLVVYYTTQEKDNPYADTSKSNYNATGKIPANTILALGMGKDYTFIKRDYINRKMTMSLTTDPRKSSHDIGPNKDYRGWDASGLGSLARIIDVADAAFVINTAALPSTRGKIEDRIKAKEGAVSFKSDKEFKDANMARYREILQKRASELPIDKLVMDAIDDATKVMKDGLKNQEKNKYGELIAGVGKDGRAYKLNDISNFINGLISDYERWSGYIAEVDEAEKKYGKDSKEYQWQARYAERESKEYAKSIKDKLAKLKKRNLAW